MNWYVLYTKSRSEKAVADRLTQAGIITYCPLLRMRRKWSDRWKWVEEPLFRSYCFVKLSNQDRDRVFYVNGVVRYLYHGGQPAIVRDSEIETLKRWLNEYDHTMIEAVSFNPKDKVFLRSGALMDKEATVINHEGHYINLMLEDLGMQIRVDLRKNIVDKVSAGNM